VWQAPGPVLWKSPDGLATISREADRINSLAVSISDLLELEVLTDSEKELIADPPVHFLNFNVRKISTTPKVHGVRGLRCTVLLPSTIAYLTVTLLRADQACAII
jgi:hypothetical protein